MFCLFDELAKACNTEWDSKPSLSATTAALNQCFLPFVLLLFSQPSCYPELNHCFSLDNSSFRSVVASL